MKSVRILRVDPERRTVATMFLRGRHDATPQIRQLTRAKELNSREIMEVGNAPLMCIARSDVEENMKGWRMRGCGDTAGVAIMTGRAPDNRLIDVPISREWLLERLIWLDREDVSDTEAESIVPSLNPEIRLALQEALVLPDGIWITAAHKAIVGDALVALGLGTERSGGQSITRLGEMVFDLLAAEER